MLTCNYNKIDEAMQIILVRLVVQINLVPSLTLLLSLIFVFPGRHFFSFSLFLCRIEGQEEGTASFRIGKERVRWGLVMMSMLVGPGYS